MRLSPTLHTGISGKALKTCISPTEALTSCLRAGPALESAQVRNHCTCEKRGSLNGSSVVGVQLQRCADSCGGVEVLTLME